MGETKTDFPSVAGFIMGLGVGVLLFTGDRAKFDETAQDVISNKSANEKNFKELKQSFKIYAYSGPNRASIARRTHAIVDLADEGKVFEQDASVDSFKANGDTLYLKDFSKETVAAVMDHLASLDGPK